MYFLELKERFTTKAWYLTLRGMASIILGFSALIFPVLAARILLTLLAVWLMGNTLEQIAALLRQGRTAWRLWRQMLLSLLISTGVGVLALIGETLVIDAATIGFGGLLFFRAMLELSIFIQAPGRVRRRRLLLAAAVVSFVAGVYLFSGPFDTDYILIRIFGVYAAVIGTLNVMSAWRVSAQIQENVAYAHSFLVEAPMVPVENASNILPPQENIATRKCRWTPVTAGSRLDPGKYRRPIIFAPHPDDLEAFSGGLAYKLHGELLSVVFAGGDKGVWSQKFAQMPPHDFVRLRLTEAAEAANLLGIKEIIYMGYMDRTVQCTEAAIQQVVDILEQHQPDLIVSFEYFRRVTPYPHPDHLEAAQIVRHAVARYQHNDCLDFLVTATLFPNVFLDVTGVRRVKLEALACHTTQVGLNKIIFPFLEGVVTRLWGIFNAVDYAEGYRVVNVPKMVRRLGVVNEYRQANYPDQLLEHPPVSDRPGRPA